MAVEKEREGWSLAAVMEGMDTKDEVPDQRTRIVQRGSTREDVVRPSEGSRAMWEICRARTRLELSGLGENLVQRSLDKREAAKTVILYVLSVGRRDGRGV